MISLGLVFLGVRYKGQSLIEDLLFSCCEYFVLRLTIALWCYVVEYVGVWLFSLPFINPSALLSSFSVVHSYKGVLHV